MVNVLTAPIEHLEFWEEVEDKMVDIPGDASQDEIDEKLRELLAAGIASSSETNPVRLTTLEATRLLEMIGPPKKKAEEVQVAVAQPHAGATIAPSVAPEAEDEDEDEDDDDKPSGSRKAPKRGGRR